LNKDKYVKFLVDKAMKELPVEICNRSAVILNKHVD